MAANKLFDCNDLSTFINSIIYVLPYSGASMSRFYMCEYNNVKFLMKLCFYRKSAYELYDKKKSKLIMNNMDAEIEILNLFKKMFVDKNITSCIIEYVYIKKCGNINKLLKNIKCDKVINEFSDLKPENDLYRSMCKYRDLVDSNLAHDRCAFIVMDKCDMSFDQYIQKTLNAHVHIYIFKSILFQIIHAFYAITRVYPNFHHWDLHTDNILLKFDQEYKFDNNSPKFLVYTIKNIEYYVPYFGIIPKIIDFGFSSVPEAKIMSMASEDILYTYYRTNNDLLLLFYWIDNIIANINKDYKNPILTLLSDLEPNKSYIHYDTSYIRKIETDIPTYEDMILNKVWNEYKNKNISEDKIYKKYEPI